METPRKSQKLESSKGNKTYKNDRKEISRKNNEDLKVWSHVRQECENFKEKE